MHLGVGWIAPVIAVAQIASHIVIQSCLGDNGTPSFTSRGDLYARQQISVPNNKVENQRPAADALPQLARIEHAPVSNETILSGCMCTGT